MTQAYSLDLRERVVAAVVSGETCRSVAERFDVGVSSVVRWSQRARETGSPAARPRGGQRPLALAGERDWLLRRLGETPDLTLRSLLPELAARGVVVSYFAVWHFFASEGISFKKKPARGRAGPAGRRASPRPLEGTPGQA